MAQQQYESVRRSVLAGVKSAYFQLAYLSKTLGILESDGQLLQQVEKAADARYRSGMGNQQDVLQAQLEQTKLLREITHAPSRSGQGRRRRSSSFSTARNLRPTLKPAELPETPLPYTFDELLAATKAQNPEISGAQKMVEKQKLASRSCPQGFLPGLQCSIHVAAHRSRHNTAPITC